MADHENQDNSDELNKEDGLEEVKLPSGESFYVHAREVAYFNDRASKYLADNHFTNISDLADIDRLLISELLVWRWGMWISQNRDYWNEPIDEQAWQKALKDHSAEIRMLKKSLGLDKETRDKQKGEGSTAQYLENIRTRALEFGYMRNDQSAQAIEEYMELQAMVTFWNNCTEKERKDQGVTTEDLFKWIMEVSMPRFNKIDEEFRKTTQKMWVQEQ